MIQNRYAVGDDIDVTVDLMLNGQPCPVNAVSATVKAAIVRPGTPTLATGTQVVTCAKDGAIAHRVTASFPHAQTGTIAPGQYEVEFQVEDSNSGKVHTFERAGIVIFAGAIPPPTPPTP